MTRKFKVVRKLSRQVDNPEVEFSAPAEVIPLALLPGAAVEDKPKRGGRPRGSLNKATRDVRIAAAKYTARALTVITKLAEQSNDPRVQLQAAIELLDRAHGKPAQTQLLGGADAGPIEIGEPLTDKELARRVGLILYRGSPDYRAASDAERAARHAEAQDEFAESVQPAQESTSASNGVGGS